MSFYHAVTLLLLTLCTMGCAREEAEIPADSEHAGSASPRADSTSGQAKASSPQGLGEQPRSRKAKTRRFRFLYGATINHLEPGAKARVWLPLPSSNHEQQVERGRVDLPAEYRETADKKYGNRLLYFEATADRQGRIPFEIEYSVVRRELLMLAAEPGKPEQQPVFLASAAMVPVDGSLLQQLLGKHKPAGNSLETARQLYDAVDLRMRYDKPAGKPWGRGDARWACGSGFGNCTDFHSLFIAACRDMGLPAKFEIGFPIPTQKESGPVAGYHCWAKFLHDGRWIAVDISEADKHPELKNYYFGNLTADRVTFSVGRDLQLDPPQQAGPVNFLVYPYVEVDGKQHTDFEKQFRYEDIASQ